MERRDIALVLTLVVVVAIIAVTAALFVGTPLPSVFEWRSGGPP